MYVCMYIYICIYILLLIIVCIIIITIIYIHVYYMHPWAYIYTHVLQYLFVQNSLRLGLSPAILESIA